MSEDNFSLVRKLLRVASEKDVKISFAESCTGGLIGATITETSGASEIFLGSAVTYANSSKEKILGVSPKTLDKYGAVSAECAEEMAADYSMSTTGIAGPEGGSDEKPVGTVWFGFSSKYKTVSFMKVFKGDRAKIREATVRQVLFFLLEELTSEQD